MTKPSHARSSPQWFLTTPEPGCSIATAWCDTCMARWMTDQEPRCTCREWLSSPKRLVAMKAIKIDKIQTAIREHVSGGCDCSDCAEALYVGLVQAGVIPSE